MNVRSLTVGLAGLLLSAPSTASPLGPGPVAHWFASSYLDTTCGGGGPFQNFSGSGGSCNVIEHMRPPAEFVVQIQSVLIGSVLGNFDFTFLPDTTCEITGLADIIHPVTSGETVCVNISGLDAGSFNVDPVPTTLKPRLLPESTWNALFYSGVSCGGAQTNSFSGSSSECVLSDDLLGSPMPPPETKSILVSANFADYAFSFFQDQTCEDTGLLERIFEVASGESLCVNYTDPVSFQVTDETTETKRSATPVETAKRSLACVHSCVAPRDGPVSIWNVTAFPDQACSEPPLQTNQGSGSSDCAALDANAGSVRVFDLFGDYAFGFFAAADCRAGPLEHPVYEVEGEQCIGLGDLRPESFTVDFVRAELKTRQGGPIAFWEASTFLSADCGGEAVANLAGAGSDCEAVASASSGTVASVLLSSADGTYSFSLFGNSECLIGPFDAEEYEVGTGESRCVAVPTGLDLSGISVDELVAPSRR